ncbi:hypothetical protein ABIB86_000422 [Bradyrhizobium sp. JR1.7]|uniref:hypothetical protein n=1 Tax=unclassified Bradyrhizobium TaxID=2631580 RepID=UPI0033974626
MFNGGLVCGISWIWYLVGTIGLGGTIVLLYLGPAVLTSIVPYLLRFFLGTRIGVGILAASITFMVADIHRSRSDAARWDAEKATFVQAQRDRDTRIATETREKVWTEIANATAENTVIDNEVKDFTDALPPTPAAAAVNPFLVGDASCKLRHIAGYAGCGPDRTQGVPKARSKGAGTGRIDWWKIGLPSLVTSGTSGTPRSQQGH